MENAPAVPEPRKERSDAMKVTPEEKADLDSRDVSRPYQRKKCLACGKPFRTCSGGRMNCYQCSPPTLGRRLDPVVKEALREQGGSGGRGGGDVRDPLAPPSDVLAALEELRAENLRPQTAADAIALLGKIGEHVAAGRISALKGRALTAIVRVQIGILERKERLAYQERAARDREHRRNMSLAKREADKRKRQEEKEAERRRRAEERKNNGGKPKAEVPLPQLSDADRRLGEDV